MSQYRVSPITEKEITDDIVAGRRTVCCNMQGWRKIQEDAHFSGELPSGMGLYCVMDGHGGEEVSMFCGRHMINMLKDLKPDFDHCEAVKVFNDMDALLLENAVELSKCTHAPKKARNSVHKMRVLEIRRENPDMEMDLINGQVLRLMVGCTCTLAIIHDNVLVCANVGDSKAVLARDCSSAGCTAVDISREHNLKDPAECARVIAAGYEVSAGATPRINAELAVARSIGDCRFKLVEGLPHSAQPVSNEPEIMTFELNERDDFLVIACDGIFECLSSQETVNYIHKGLSEGKEPAAVISEMMDSIIAPKLPPEHGGGDNMTCMIVFLKPWTGAFSPA